MSAMQNQTFGAFISNASVVSAHHLSLFSVGSFLPVYFHSICITCGPKCLLSFNPVRVFHFGCPFRFDHSSLLRFCPEAQGVAHYASNIAEPLPLGDGPERLILARQAFLATLPLPADIPDDALNPIVIPQPYILHEFLGNTSGTLKSSLSNYRVLGQPTTYWCPEREEHGYLLTPVFKCSANPRVTTAHRWTVADVIGTMDRPTECFYNKDGKWYYAGVYEAFRMDDLTTEEWEALSIETTQTLVKETLAGRKNLSPQNLYETGQLYAVGALRVACIGLQCVGFSSAMYRAVLEQAALGKWRGIGWSVPTTISSSDTTIEGDGTPGP
ncbi:hypothetical protein C8R48DRAFT_782258 [Suillus tomentosus]|nr:hypothetical protein C8R48DRAFT_782258 [Suillus tomentosus]